MDENDYDAVKRRRGLIPEDLLKFRWLDEIALSPAGTQIAYTIRRPMLPPTAIPAICICKI